MYWDQNAAVRIEIGMTNWIEIHRGVRQGCVLSLDLFSQYEHKCMEEIEEMERIKIEGRNVNSITYTDDTVLITDAEAMLQRLTVSGLSAAYIRRAQEINPIKT